MRAVWSGVMAACPLTRVPRRAFVVACVATPRSLGANFLLQPTDGDDLLDAGGPSSHNSSSRTHSDEDEDEAYEPQSGRRARAGLVAKRKRLSGRSPHEHRGVCATDGLEIYTDKELHSWIGKHVQQAVVQLNSVGCSVRGRPPQSNFLPARATPLLMMTSIECVYPARPRWLADFRPGLTMWRDSCPSSVDRITIVQTCPPASSRAHSAAERQRTRYGFDCGERGWHTVPRRHPCARFRDHAVLPRRSAPAHASSVQRRIYFLSSVLAILLTLLGQASRTWCDCAALCRPSTSRCSPSCAAHCWAPLPSAAAARMAGAKMFGSLMCHTQAPMRCNAMSMLLDVLEPIVD